MQFGLVPMVDRQNGDRHRIGSTRSTDPAIGSTFSADERMDWYVSLQQSRRQDRLDPDAIDDAIEDAAFIDIENGLRVGAIDATGDGLTFEALVGGVSRTIEIDQNGDSISESDLGATPFFGLAVSGTF